MNAHRSLLLWLCAFFVSGATPTIAQSLLGQSEWLPEGSDLGAAVLARPREVLRVEKEGGVPSFMVRLGELAFRSSETLGGNARRAGIACDTCHSGGARNVRFFIPGLSSKPGTVDVTHHLWNRNSDDGIDNPIVIPSLRNVDRHSPYGFRGDFPSLREFTRRVIVQEFAGAEPPALLLDALVAYQLELRQLPNPLLDPEGHLTPAAPNEARAGETLFGLHCAACHMPGNDFRDGQLHDVGSGGPVKTPSLLGLQDGPPYFHDGRFDTLGQVVGYFVNRFDVKLDEGQRHALARYLEVIAYGEAPTEAITLSGDLDRLGRSIELSRTSLLDENADLTELITRMLRGELGRIFARFHAPAQEPARLVLRGWAQTLVEIDRLATAHDYPKARALLDVLERRLIEEAGPLASAEATSLYNPETLRAALVHATNGDVR